MSAVRNILFVMYDQLRWDYLSCYGHPSLQTPHFDRLAARGVRFDRAYVQSPVCGPSRMSAYTGRYVSSHGAAFNNFPLKVGEMTLGDHLRPHGMECWLVGKTHMSADAAGMARLGLAADSVIGARLAECGFDPWVRDDGLWSGGPDGIYDSRRSPYNEFLKAQGYSAANPWEHNANSVVDETGRVLSGWLMQNARHPANIPDAHSETPWLTDRMLEFLAGRGDAAPWLVHLSYIKPHWPYVVPAPYHAMYGHNHILPANRDEAERQDPHPVYAAFMNNAIGRAFARDEVRETVIPAYMGLVKQCDDQLGRLLDALEAQGRMQDTMIVLTSDHGDYLGDHWLGEKDLFHDASARVPLIVYDPSPEADATRGSVRGDLVELIDLAATFVDAVAGEVPAHVLEGRSLLPLLRDPSAVLDRAVAVSEYDYSATPMAARLGVTPRDARLFMVTDGRWKMMHAEGGMRPMLFDLVNDPLERVDLGADPGFAGARAQMYEHLACWSRRMAQRTTISDAQIIARRGASRRKGIYVGVWDGSELDADVRAHLGIAEPPAG